MTQIERAIETVIVQSRWLAAPFLLGLVIGLAALLCTFALKLVSFLTLVGIGTEDQVIVGVLKLVDLSLTANLLLIVTCSGYENFVSRIAPEAQRNLPEGLIGIGFSGLKHKLLGSILAIAAVSVLEWFMDIERSADNTKLAWVVGILLALAVAMLLLAIADRLSGAHHKDSYRSARLPSHRKTHSGVGNRKRMLARRKGVPTVAKPIHLQIGEHGRGEQSEVGDGVRAASTPSINGPRLPSCSCEIPGA